MTPLATRPATLVVSSVLIAIALAPTAWAADGIPSVTVPTDAPVDAGITVGGRDACTAMGILAALNVACVTLSPATHTASDKLASATGSAPDASGLTQGAIAGITGHAAGAPPASGSAPAQSSAPGNRDLTTASPRASNVASALLVVLGLVLIALVVLGLVALRDTKKEADPRTQDARKA